MRRSGPFHFGVISVFTKFEVASGEQNNNPFIISASKYHNIVSSFLSSDYKKVVEVA